MEHNPQVRGKFKGFKIRKEVLEKICKVGLPTIITQALGSIIVSAADGGH